MWRCSCGHESTDDHRFCSACGIKRQEYGQYAPPSSSNSTPFQNPAPSSSVSPSTTYAPDDPENPINIQWYYQKTNQRIGPVPYEEIKKLLDRGEISRNTYIWHKGLTAWIPIYQSTLAAYAAQTMPPLPPQILSNRFLWALVFVPMLVCATMYALDANYLAIAVVSIILNLLFISLDYLEMMSSGYEVTAWIWLGLLCVPVYLFIRAALTNKKYACAITYTIIAVISFFGT